MTETASGTQRCFSALESPLVSPGLGTGFQRERRQQSDLVGWHSLEKWGLRQAMAEPLPSMPATSAEDREVLMLVSGHLRASGMKRR